MAISVNLSRNTKCWYTTVTADTGYTSSNTFEIQVMDGYQFTQNTEQQTIQLNEAGTTPNRGQRSFNTKLNPVEWSFGTYVRPQLFAAGGTTTINSATATAGVATAICAATHALSHGDVVATVGLTTATFNRSFVPVAVVDTTTFTYPISTTTTITATGATKTVQKVARVSCVERFLWNALAGTMDVYDPANSSPAWVEASGSATLQFSQSNAHTLSPFALIFKVDTQYYKISNCAVNQAELSFGLDQISMINWSGYGTSVAEIASTATGATQLNALTTNAPADTTADFINNKLTTVVLNSNISGDGTGGSKAYTLPITGGTLTIANNLSYLTPEILGTVNKPVGYYTGTRAVGGNLTAYLRTGATASPWSTGTLLQDILTTSNTNPETKFNLSVYVGGQTNATRLELTMPACMLQVPSVEIQDVVSTTINFTAQGYLSTDYDITAVNELGVKYITA